MKRKQIGSLFLVVLALTITLPLSSVLVTGVTAQGNTTFPGSGTFNGMQILYSIQGCTLNPPEDTGGFVPTREYTGTVSAGSTITVSGTFHMEWEASTGGTVSVNAGSASDSLNYNLTSSGPTPLVNQPFSVSITVPSNARYASFSISMDASYGNGESRGLEVIGSLDVEGGSTAVDHITLFSNAATDYIYAGSSPFTLTATVYGEGDTMVPDGTVVTFEIADRFGTLAGARVSPTSAGTVSSDVTVTFTPPNSSYWDDPNHNPTATNRITITASAGDKQATYIIYIEPDESAPTNSYTTQPTPPPTSSGSGSPCIIATATYGGPLAAEVVFMRSVRDDMIGASATGSILVTAWNAFYYSWSPPVASAIDGSNALQTSFQVVLAPLLASMHLVAFTYNGLTWINADFAAAVAFTVAAILSISIYILLPAVLIRYTIVHIKTRRLNASNMKP